MRTTVLLLVAFALAACDADDPVSTRYGPVEVIRTEASFADDVEIIVSDLRLEPNSEIPHHQHTTEELVYVLEGSVLHIEDGRPDRTLRAGDMVVIAPHKAHGPRVGPEGARAISIKFEKSDAVEPAPIEQN